MDPSAGTWGQKKGRSEDRPSLNRLSVVDYGVTAPKLSIVIVTFSTALSCKLHELIEYGGFPITTVNSCFRLISLTASASWARAGRFRFARTAARGMV